MKTYKHLFIQLEALHADLMTLIQKDMIAYLEEGGMYELMHAVATSSEAATAIQSPHLKRLIKMCNDMISLMAILDESGHALDQAFNKTKPEEKQEECKYLISFDKIDEMIACIRVNQLNDDETETYVKEFLQEFKSNT